MLEKVVAKQLNAVSERHIIHDQFQSGFGKQHSTETAPRVSNDILTSSDVGNCSALVRLDLS